MKDEKTKKIPPKEIFSKEMLQEIVQQLRPPKKTKPWTLKVALRPSGVLLVCRGRLFLWTLVLPDELALLMRFCAAAASTWSHDAFVSKHIKKWRRQRVGAERAVNSEHVQVLVENLLQTHWTWQEHKNDAVLHGAHVYKTMYLAILDVKTTFDVQAGYCC